MIRPTCSLVSRSFLVGIYFIWILLGAALHLCNDRRA